MKRRKWPPTTAQVTAMDPKWIDNPALPWPDIMVLEHALLVARGVRPMALLGAISTDPGEMHYTSMKLDGYAVQAGDNVIGFVVDNGHGFAQCGFAGAPWVVELLRFAYSKAAKNHQHQILGLLLGYSAEAIERHERFNAGKPQFAH